MRLKTYTAKSMADVMTRVREEIGPDAIIVRTDQGARVGGVRVTVAYETAHKDQAPIEAIKPVPAAKPSKRTEDRPFDEADMKAAFAHHGLPYPTIERLNHAVHSIEAQSLPEALSFAFETIMKFAPYTPATGKSVILIGPPGAGKTVVAAKLAAESILNGEKVELLTTDIVKSSGLEQLQHYAKLMKIDAEAADDPAQLEKMVKAIPANTTTIIDTYGVNPFSMEDMQAAARFIKASGAEPVLVLPSGMDPLEAGDIAEVFSSMGVSRFIATRVDTARRFASILTAAMSGRMALAGIGNSPYVAERVEPATPIGLARMIATLPKSKSKKISNKRAKS